MFPILPAGSITEGTVLPAFLVARDGLYLRKRSLLGVSQTKVGRIAHLPEGTEFVHYALPPVPADVMARVVGFFRAVHAAQGTEAAVLLVWRDGVFDLVVPRQSATSVSVSFRVAEGDIPPGWRVVGSMHSHGAYGAYASTTDEDDEEKIDGLHVVVGRIDKRRIDYAAAIVVDGVRFVLRTNHLFRRPRLLSDPPADWLARVTVARAPRRLSKPSPVEWLARGFRPADEIGRPSRDELTAAIDRAARMAASLGFELRHWLVQSPEAAASPAAVPETTREGSDA